MSHYVNDGAEVEGSASDDEEEDDDTIAQHRNNERIGSPGPDDHSGEEDVPAEGADEMEEDEEESEPAASRVPPASGRLPPSNEDRRAQNVAAIEGVTSEVEKFTKAAARSQMIWANDIDRYRQTDIPEAWEAWGRVPDNSDGHLKLRENWLSWMACTSKLLQTVDNRHLNRHLDYQYSGPTINFVDLQGTPQIGRRLQILAHLVECMNNFGEFPLDCVVPTPETEIVMGSGRSGKLVRGMRMKNPDKKVAREVELVSTQHGRATERWLRDFNRGFYPTNLHIDTVHNTCSKKVYKVVSCTVIIFHNIVIHSTLRIDVSVV